MKGLEPSMFCMARTALEVTGAVCGRQIDSILAFLLPLWRQGLPATDIRT
jgi:hypothetical protein